MEQSRCATGMNASSTKIWCCGRAWSRPQRQGRTASLPSTEEPSLPRTIRGGKAMRKEESSCCWIERKCQHSLGPPPPLRPKRAAGLRSGGGPNDNNKAKKGDTSNEVKRGTFLMRLDISSLSSLTCFLAPPKMSAKYRIPLRSDSWFAALIGEPIFNAPSGPLKGVGDEGTFWSPRCAVSGSFLGVCEPGLSAGEHRRGAVERHGAGRKRRHRQRGHCRSASHGHESFLYDQLKRFRILRRGEPSPGALRTDDGI